MKTLLLVLSVVGVCYYGNIAWHYHGEQVECMWTGLLLSMFINNVLDCIFKD